MTSDKQTTVIVELKESRLPKQSGRRKQTKASLKQLEAKRKAKR
ncbi:hypothetical protein PO124_04975 [Bacillus licheniformis]|nr:hypothetical protein [Bacillus licheniformis]